MPQYECSECRKLKRKKLIGNTDYPSRSKGALVRHLKGEEPYGHGLSLEEARRVAGEITGV